MKDSIKAIIFDYAGVIGNEPSNYVLTTISRRFKIEHQKIQEEIFKLVPKLQKNYLPESIFWNKLTKIMGLNNSREAKKIWMEEYEKTKIDKRLISLIRKLKKKGYKLCLLSNTTKFLKNVSFRKLLKKEFHTIIYSCDIQMRKPEKRIYLLTLRRLKMKPKECLIIENERKNLYYPKKMGMKTIYFKSYKQLKDDLLHQNVSLH